MSCDSDKFNLLVVHDNFSKSLELDDDVSLLEYLKSYEELNKFFNLMGSVFGFVSKDLKSKIDILTDLLATNSTNFHTAKEMIQYEKNNSFLYKNGYTSGSRTLLRLHRGLDFIRSFLKSIGNLKDDESTASCCRTAYDDTLAQHHPFLIRKGAQIAMYTLPTRQELLKRVCGENEEHIKNTINILPKTLDVTAIVYHRIESLYTSHDLHSLP